MFGVEAVAFGFGGFLGVGVGFVKVCHDVTGGVFENNPSVKVFADAVRLEFFDRCAEFKECGDYKKTAADMVYDLNERSAFFFILANFHFVSDLKVDGDYCSAFVLRHFCYIALAELAAGVMLGLGAD